MRFGLVEGGALIAAHPVLEGRCQWAPKSPVETAVFAIFGFPSWRSAAAGWRRRGNEGFGAKVLGHQIGVLTESITGAFDLGDYGVVKQPIKECGGDNGITEDLAPFCEAAVRGEDHGSLFVSCIDELEEQIAAAGNDWQIADFVDDQQRWHR
jgi:hypothetical protein